MPAPDEEPHDAGQRPLEGMPSTDEATIQAEEELQDRESASEAMDEALGLGAVPWGRVKHEDDRGEASGPSAPAPA